MKITREKLAFVGFLLLAFGVEMVVVQQVVLKEFVASAVVETWSDVPAPFATDFAPNRLALPIPSVVGHCVATGGFVLILCCFIVVKPDE